MHICNEGILEKGVFMYTNILSGMMKGMEAALIRVEVDASFGLPMFDMVGNMSGEVKEARERVKVALKNIGMQIPNLRLTVNLSPAQIRKEGTAFDLPIAVGVLVATEIMEGKGLEKGGRKARYEPRALGQTAFPSRRPYGRVHLGEGTRGASV